MLYSPAGAAEPRELPREQSIKLGAEGGEREGEGGAAEYHHHPEPLIPTLHTSEDGANPPLRTVPRYRPLRHRRSHHHSDGRRTGAALFNLKDEGCDVLHEPGLHRKTFPPFEAAAPEHRAAGARTRAPEEPMRPFPLPPLRSIGNAHATYPIQANCS